MLLALDLALKTGWAAGIPCGPVSHGSFKLHGTADPARLLEMVREVTALLDRFNVTHMVAEAPFIGKRRNTAMALYGYRAAAMIACANKKVRVHDLVEPSKIRKHFIGAGGLKRADAKSAVIEKCQWRGWTPANDDEADALALWDYQCALLDPNHFTMGMRRNAWATTLTTSSAGSASG